LIDIAAAAIANIIMIALVVAALALSLLGCSSAPPKANVKAATVKDAPSTPKAPTPVSATNLLSPAEPGTGTPFPTGSQTPKVVTDHLTSKTPMLVYFFDPKQSTSKDQRREIDAAMKEYRGMIDLVAFDVTGALPDPVTNERSKDPVAQQVALLTQDLQLGFTPYVVLVDKQGMMTGRYRGYLDRALLDREILKATQ
jgi:hypothetical protein